MRDVWHVNTMIEDDEVPRDQMGMEGACQRSGFLDGLVVMNSQVYMNKKKYIYYPYEIEKRIT